MALNFLSAHLSTSGSCASPFNSMTSVVKLTSTGATPRPAGAIGFPARLVWSAGCLQSAAASWAPTDRPALSGLVTITNRHLPSLAAAQTLPMSRFSRESALS